MWKERCRLSVLSHHLLPGSGLRQTNLSQFFFNGIHHDVRGSIKKIEQRYVRHN